MIVKAIEVESKTQKLFNNLNLESNVNNFTINLIKKWISEYSPKKDEYKQRIEMILDAKKQPSKMSEKIVNSYFLSDVTSDEFLKDPLTILSFDYKSVVPYMKSIHYFIEFTENMLSFEESCLQIDNSHDELSFRRNCFHENCMNKMIDKVLEKIQKSLGN